MDDPGLDPGRHRHALSGLSRINRLSNTAGILWPAIRRLAARQPQRPLRILDVATGGGDVLVRMCTLARQHGVKLDAHGCDISPRALEFARQRAAGSAVDAQFFELDAVTGDLPDGFDVVMSSLFLHHLDEGDTTALLRRAGQAAGRAVLISDLRRSACGYALAWVVVRCLTTSRVVHTDGPLSVRAAYTLPEIRDIAARAGLGDATIQRSWPWRFVLEWHRQ